jgi:hypothetical protein
MKASEAIKNNATRRGQSNAMKKNKDLENGLPEIDANNLSI